MNSLAMIAMNMIQNNPRVANDPKAQECIEAIKSGDDAKGERLAQELCSQHGTTVPETMTKARKFFGL